MHITYYYQTSINKTYFHWIQQNELKRLFILQFKYNFSAFPWNLWFCLRNTVISGIFLRLNQRKFQQLIQSNAYYNKGGFCIEFQIPHLNIARKATYQMKRKCMQQQRLNLN
ncbi:unnamed protein product [Paramecium octaurelia]|uniref:Uncharacterized protein n=1 Tax=Paramecium octaurelia TaxID=43137 RepID=A0A8S1YMH6_PAROT|nr:unnamed protein product [Paramecium octaurelia]